MSKSGEVLGDFDVTQTFNLLESNNPDVAQEIKALINEQFNSSK
jgi:hypothetical protein